MKITRNMELTIMQANKNFNNNRLLRIFRRSNAIWKTFVKYLNNWDERIPDNCEELFVHVFRQKRSCKVAGAKDSWKIAKYFRLSCSNKSNWK